MPGSPALDGRRCDEASVQPGAGTTPYGTVDVTTMRSPGRVPVSPSVGSVSLSLKQVSRPASRPAITVAVSVTTDRGGCARTQTHHYVHLRPRPQREVCGHSTE